MKKLIGAFAALFIFGALGAYVIVQARHIGYNQYYQPDQPVKFSHKLHAGDLQIDCQYCHFGADKGRHAGIPPTELCMNCHTQVKPNSPEIRKLSEALDSGENIEWVRVNLFPDYAYFNHAQHVNVAELDCMQCHGPVDEMEIYYQHEKLNMGWCINCHRGEGIAPPNDHKNASGGDCQKCHY